MSKSYLRKRNLWEVCKKQDHHVWSVYHTAECFIKLFSGNGYFCLSFYHMKIGNNEDQSLQVKPETGARIVYDNLDDAYLCIVHYGTWGSHLASVFTNSVSEVKESVKLKQRIIFQVLGFKMQSGYFSFQVCVILWILQWWLLNTPVAPL